MTEKEAASPDITVNQINYLRDFVCLADKCEDTCCKGWGMQVDDKRLKLYQEKAPELMEAVTSGETAHIMKRDEKTGACVKLTDKGLCGIQEKYGSDYLPDSCHFYPRITRKFGDDHYISASLSCPEIARLALFGKKDGFAFAKNPVPRITGSLKDYLTDLGLDKNSAIEVFEKFLELAADENATPERILSRIITVSHILDGTPKEEWLATIDSFLPEIDDSLSAPESSPSDPYNLLNILTGLASGTKHPIAPRLMKVVASIEEGLGVRVNWERKTVERAAKKDYGEIRSNYYRDISPTVSAFLRNWIKTELAAATFPFGGLGNNINERAVIIAVRFATLKLAIMSNMQQFIKEPQETMVFLTQSLARFLDHLADPELSIACYKEAGWLGLARLRGLIGDV